MRATICKWGNSLGIRIPRGLAKDAGLAEGTVVELHLEDSRLVAEPVAVEKLELLSTRFERTQRDSITLRMPRFHPRRMFACSLGTERSIPGPMTFQASQSPHDHRAVGAPLLARAAPTQDATRSARNRHGMSCFAAATASAVMFPRRENPPESRSWSAR
jgi:antitoxin component of MazEF toxin-antitoxin module